eukprot:11032896-Ditylum_brightwellii.AAC.1
MAENLGILAPYPPRGPWPLSDNFGVFVVLQILRVSVKPSLYLSNLQLYATVQRLSSVYSNMNDSTSVAHVQVLHFNGDALCSCGA